METFFNMVLRMGRSPRGTQLLQLLRDLPAAPMVRSTKTGIWHVAATCPTSYGALEEVSLTLWSLPEEQQYCTSCTSARAFPLGKMLTVFGDATEVFDTPLDWSGVQCRRRFAVDPLRSCTVRPPSPTWDEIREALAPHITEELTAATDAARSLSRAPLHNAVLASVIIEGTDVPSYADRVELQRLAGLHLPVLLTTEMQTRLTTLAAVGTATVFCVAPHAQRLADGADLERIIDLELCAATRQVDAYSAVFDTPRAALDLLASARGFTAVEITEEVPDPVLAWASALYRTAPHRGLLAALHAARRLAVTR